MPELPCKLECSITEVGTPPFLECMIGTSWSNSQFGDMISMVGGVVFGDIERMHCHGDTWTPTEKQGLFTSVSQHGTISD